MSCHSIHLESVRREWRATAPSGLLLALSPKTRPRKEKERFPNSHFSLLLRYSRGPILPRLERTGVVWAISRQWASNVGPHQVMQTPSLTQKDSPSSNHSDKKMGSRSHQGFPGGTVVKNQPANAGDARDMGSIPGSGKSPGEGNGNPLQYSCLENPTDREAWQE